MDIGNIFFVETFLVLVVVEMVVFVVEILVLFLVVVLLEFFLFEFELLEWRGLVKLRGVRRGGDSLGWFIRLWVFFCVVGLGVAFIVFIVWFWRLEDLSLEVLGMGGVFLGLWNDYVVRFFLLRGKRFGFGGVFEFFCDFFGGIIGVLFNCGTV